MKSFLLLALLIVQLLAQVPWPHDGPQDDDPAMNRQIFMEELSNNAVSVKSVRVSDTLLEVFKFQVLLESGDGNNLAGPVLVALRYFALNNTKNNVQVTEDKFLARFDSLTYTNATNATTSIINLADLQFLPLQVTQAGNSLNVTATDVNGVFQLVVHIVSTVTMLGQTPVRPSSVKFDVNIQKQKTDNLNLNANLFSNQEIATLSDNISAEEKEGFAVQSEKQIAFGAGAVKNAFFSWILQANIGGTTVQVVDTQVAPQPSNGEEGLENGNKKAVTFTFPTTLTGLLKWDPKVGQETFSAIGSTSSASYTIISMVWVMLLCYLCKK